MVHEPFPKPALVEGRGVRPGQCRREGLSSSRVFGDWVGRPQQAHPEELRGQHRAFKPVPVPLLGGWKSTAPSTARIAQNLMNSLGWLKRRKKGKLVVLFWNGGLLFQHAFYSCFLFLLSLKVLEVLDPERQL